MNQIGRRIVGDDTPPLGVHDGVRQMPQRTTIGGIIVERVHAAGGIDLRGLGLEPGRRRGIDLGDFLELQAANVRLGADDIVVLQDQGFSTRP